MWWALNAIHYGLKPTLNGIGANDFTSGFTLASPLVSLSVTVALASVGKFPVKKIVHYVLAQFLGGMAYWRSERVRWGPRRHSLQCLSNPSNGYSLKALQESRVQLMALLWMQPQFNGVQLIRYWAELSRTRGLMRFWNEFRFLRSGDRLLYILRRFASISPTLNSNRILIKKVKEIKLFAINWITFGMFRMSVVMWTEIHPKNVIFFLWVTYKAWEVLREYQFTVRPIDHKESRFYTNI